MSDSCASGQAGVLLFSPQQAPGLLQPPLELILPQHNFPLYHFLPKDAVVASIICTALTSLPKSLRQGLLQALMLLLAWKVWEQFRGPKHTADFYCDLMAFQFPHLESLPST